MQLLVYILQNEMFRFENFIYYFVKSIHFASSLPFLLPFRRGNQGTGMHGCNDRSHVYVSWHDSEDMTSLVLKAASRADGVFE